MRDRHPLQPRLLPDRGKQVQARRGSRDTGRNVLRAPRPGQRFEPARTPTQLFGHTLGSQRGGAAGRQGNCSDGNGLAHGPERQRDENTNRLCRTGVGPPGETTMHRSTEARSASRMSSLRYGFFAGQLVEATVCPLAGGGIMSSPPVAPEMRLHCIESQAEQNDASFPASASPFQCCSAVGSAATARNCGACSELLAGLRSGSNMQRPNEPIDQRDERRQGIVAIRPMIYRSQIMPSKEKSNPLRRKAKKVPSWCEGSMHCGCELNACSYFPW